MKKNLIYWALFVVCILSLIKIYLATQLPIMGDGGFHAQIIEKMISEQKIGNLGNYPLLYHWTHALYGNIVGIDFYRFLTPIVCSVFLTIVLFLLGKELTNNKFIGLIFAFLGTIHPYVMLFSSVLFMDAYLAFFILFTEFVLLKYIRTDKKQWLLVLIIMIACCVSIKQFGYIVPPIISLQYFVLKFKKESLSLMIKKLFLINVVAFVLCFPFLYHMYEVHGTIIDPANPLVGGGNYEVNKDAFDYIYKSGIFKYNHLNSRTTLFDIINFYNIRDYYSVRYLNKVIFLILSLIGVGVFIGRKKLMPSFIFILIAIIPYHLVLTKVRTEKYFLNIKLISLLFISVGIYWLFKKYRIFYYNIKNIIFSLLLVNLLLLYYSGIEHTLSRQKNMCWIPSKYQYTELIGAYEYINKNSKKDDIMLGPCRQSAVYYSNRKFMWLSPFNNADFFIELNRLNFGEKVDNEKLISYLDRNNIKFILIMDNLIKSYKNTTQSISRKELDFLKRKTYLKEINSYKGVNLFLYEKNINNQG